MTDLSLFNNGQDRATPEAGSAADSPPASCSDSGAPGGLFRGGCLSHAGIGYIAVLLMEAVLTVVIRVPGDDLRRLPGIFYLYLIVVIAASSLWSLRHALVATIASIAAESFWVIPRDEARSLGVGFDVRLAIFGAVALAISMAQFYLVEQRRRLHVRYQLQRVVTDTLQTALLPRSTTIPGYDTAHVYRPAAQEANVGGDFLDVLPLGDRRFAVILGDVTGHGLQAAVQTAEVRYSLRAYLFEGRSPASSLSCVNDIIHSSDWGEHYATVFLAVLDTRTHHLTYASAGHEPAILWHAAEDAVESLATGGLMLGVMQGHLHTIEERTVTLSPGDTLLIYTDGVTEARNERKAGAPFFGVERVIQLFRESAPGSAAEGSHRLSDAVRRFSGDSLRDDVAILWLKRTLPVRAALGRQVGTTAGELIQCDL